MLRIKLKFALLSVGPVVVRINAMPGTYVVEGNVSEISLCAVVLSGSSLTSNDTVVIDLDFIDFDAGKPNYFINSNNIAHWVLCSGW